MDLLNHFFRKRTAGGGEEEKAAGMAEKPEASGNSPEKKVADAGPAPSVEQTMAAAAARWRLDRERGIVARPATGAAPKQPESERTPASEVMLVLDDILPRLPTECLQPGMHDPERELRLSSEDLIAGIARGRATIPLSKLAARYPDIFQSPRTAAADVAVYLPLQKVLRQLSKAGSRPGNHGAFASVETPTASPFAPPRVENNAAPASRTIPPVVAETLLKPSLHGDLHGLASSTPPPPPPAEDLPVLTPSPPAQIEAPLVRLDPPQPPSIPSVAFPAATVRQPAPPTQPAHSAEPAEPAEPAQPPEPVVPPPSSQPAARIELATGALPAVKAAAPAINPPPNADASPAPEGHPKLAGGRSEATPPEPTPPHARAPEGPHETPPQKSVPAVTPEPPPFEAPVVIETPATAAIPPERPPETSRAETTSPPAPVPPPHIETPADTTPSAHSAPAPPPLFAPENLRPIETPTPPTVPLPFFAAQAPVPPPQTSPNSAPRVAPPPLRVPHAESAPAAPPPKTVPAEAHDPRANAAPSDSPSVPLRIAPMPAAVRPPAINLYAGVHISPATEPLVEAEPVDERPPSPAPPPAPIEEPAFAPEPQTYATPAEVEPVFEPIVATPVPAPPAAPMVEYPIERIEQAPLQAIFMTEDELTLPRISELSATLPGVSGCLILAGESLAQGGERPAGLNAQTLRDLSDRLTAAAESVSDKLQADRTFTLYGGNRALSLFARQQLCLCVVHGNRGFLPGVRERLTAVADTLARGMEAVEE